MHFKVGILCGAQGQQEVLLDPGRHFHLEMQSSTDPRLHPAFQSSSTTRSLGSAGDSLADPGLLLTLLLLSTPLFSLPLIEAASRGGREQLVD